MYGMCVDTLILQTPACEGGIWPARFVSPRHASAMGTCKKFPGPLASQDAAIAHPEKMEDLPWLQRDAGIFPAEHGLWDTLGNSSPTCPSSPFRVAFLQLQRKRRTLGEIRRRQSRQDEGSICNMWLVSVVLPTSN